jgi:hypothetical protein
VLFAAAEEEHRLGSLQKLEANEKPLVTEDMAADFLPFIRNHYDWITTPPPSAGRSPLRYCTYDLARAVSRRTGIPFAPAFSQKTDKLRHGRHAGPVK